MRRIISFVLLFGWALSSSAQLTTDERLADFRNLVDTFAKYYAFYEWKRDAIKFDALNLKPWVDRISSAKDDLDFYDIMIEYVGNLNDAHDSYSLPSTFRATIGFTVDIYDGKALIDSIDRDRLPETDYKFTIGDEVVSVDGKTAEDIINAYLKYGVAANPRSTRREAASLITRRFQSFMPRAHEIAEKADVVVRTGSGDSLTYSIPWVKTGIPVTVLSPSPPVTNASPKITSRPRSAEGYTNVLPRLRNYLLPHPPAVVGIQAKGPVFTMPPEVFEQRLGVSQNDAIFSGILKAGGSRIGFIRIPNFLLSFRAKDQFKKEIAFFNDNTDGLIVDLTRNPGGDPCDAEELLTYLIPNKFRVLSQQLRVAWSDVLFYSEQLDSARDFGSDEDVAQLEQLLNATQKALQNHSFRTEPLPLCGVTLDRDPAVDKTGKVIAYSKPVMVLVDEFSASSAEIFAAAFQDNARGKLFGWRTMGAGGAVGQLAVGVYSEGVTSMTFASLNRKDPVATPDYPTAPYIENIGVRPETTFDYMTRDNLINKGRPFVDAFTAAMVDLINASH